MELSSYDRLPELVKEEINRTVLDGGAVESSELAPAAIERARQVQRSTPWLALIMMLSDVAGVGVGAWMAYRTDLDAPIHIWVIVGGLVLPFILGPVAYVHGMAMRAETRNRRLVSQTDPVPDSTGSSLIRIGQIVMAFCACFGTLWFGGLFVGVILGATGVQIRSSIATSLSAGFLVALTAIYDRLLSS